MKEAEVQTSETTKSSGFLYSMQIWPLGIRSGSIAPYSDAAVRSSGGRN